MCGCEGQRHLNSLRLPHVGIGRFSVTPAPTSDTEAEPTKAAAPFPIRLHLRRRRTQVSPAKL